jgi:alpha-galactosidase
MLRNVAIAPMAIMFIFTAFLLPLPNQAISHSSPLFPQDAFNRPNHQQQRIRNGLADVPFMGWSTWGQFQCNINEDLILAMAQAIKLQKLDAAGYTVIAIDDCWQSPARANGSLVPDPVKFPRGIRYIADQLHSMGLQLGIYTDIGKQTCQGFPGSFEYWQKDTETFAAWGVDAVKVDFCHRARHELLHPEQYYMLFGAALISSGRSMIYQVCNWGLMKPWQWARDTGANSWRVANDGFPAWTSTMRILGDYDRHSLQRYASPGGWNDLDFLMAGVNGTWFNWNSSSAAVAAAADAAAAAAAAGDADASSFTLGGSTALSQTEARSQFSLWSLSASPLVLSADLTNPALGWVAPMVSNAAVIAINQDPLGIPGMLFDEVLTGIHVKGVCLGSHCSHLQLWMRPLSRAAVAVVILNVASPFTSDSSKFSTESYDLFLPALGFSLREPLVITDLWTGLQQTVMTPTFTVADVVQHGCRMFKVNQQEYKY